MNTYTIRFEEGVEFIEADICIVGDCGSLEFYDYSGPYSDDGREYEFVRACAPGRWWSVNNDSTTPRGATSVPLKEAEDGGRGAGVPHTTGSGYGLKVHAVGDVEDASVDDHPSALQLLVDWMRKRGWIQ